MVPTMADHRSTTARGALARLGTFGAVGLGLAALNAATGLGLPCPFRIATGLRCPLCGATTMGVALLHADLAAAWQANAFVLCVLGLLAVAGVVWSLELVLARRLWPVGWPGSLDRWLAVWAVLGTVFAVLREVH